VFWFVQFNESFNGRCGGVQGYVAPCCVGRDKCPTAVDNLPDLGLKGIRGIGFGCVTIVGLYKLFHLGFILCCGENY
jgi:hypothetical protein